MKTDLYNKHHLIFILLLLYQTSPSRSIIYTIFPFIFLYVLPIHSLNLPPRRSRQVPLYFPDPTACQRAQGLKQRSLTPFCLPPFKGWVTSTARRKGHLQKSKKFWHLFKNRSPSLSISQSPVIYIVEGHEEPAALTEAAPYISQMRIRNDPMERQIQKGYRLPVPTFSGKVKISTNWKTAEKLRTPENPYRAEMTGRKQGNPCVSEIPSPAVPRGNFNPTLLGKFFPPLTSHIYKWLWRTCNAIIW